MNDRERFEQWEKKTGALGYALSLHGLDANNRPPQEGRTYREAMASVLAAEKFSLEHDPKIFEVLKRLNEAADTDPVLRRKTQLHLRNLSRTALVPEDEYIAWRKALAESIAAWLRYRNTGDWKSYAPYLRDLVDAHIHMNSYRLKDGEDLYDVLLDDHEPGWNTKRYDAFFTRAAGTSKEVLQAAAKEEIDDSFLHRFCPADLQRGYMPEVLSYMGFTEAWGKIGESEHPLTTALTAGDVRFTTKNRENDVSAAILSSVHEIGHAWFGHNVDPAYEGSIIARSISAGLHESQSRLYENHLGRSLSFWKYHLPKLQGVFPEQLNGITPEQFTRALNKAEPTLIRTQADEVTYPLHILIRYEIEKMMFSKNADILHLDEVWNEMYGQYLGLDVPDASQGIMQDMHWPYAYFGYFPTYALGSAFAAQFYEALAEDVDVGLLLETGETAQIFRWLKEHVQHWAAFISSDEIIRAATGRDFDIDIWCRYIKDKYSGIYRL